MSDPATLAERLVVSTLAERPDWRDKVFAPEIQSAVPEFMRHDRAGSLYYGDGRLDRFLEYGIVAVDPAEPDRPVARAFCVPFAFRDGRLQRAELPDRGWDEVIRWGDEDHGAGCRPNAVSALEIMVAPRLHGQGIAQRMLAAMRDNVRRLGFADLYAPLRPTMKDKEPLTPVAEYAARRRADGMPWDPWVRVHVRAGAEIIKVAPLSMVVTGTLAEWSAWTGMSFDRSGPAIVPGALSPVHVSCEQDYAVYVEPNLWVHHRVG
jgi:GNAT superfamily N-acetyltransferase